MFERVLLFGYGTMASAMLQGWLASGLEPERFTVYNPRPKPVPPGIALTCRVPAGPFDAVVLGVKPQLLDAVVGEVEPLAGPRCVLVSILAAIALPALSKRFPRAGGIARLMPNLAVSIGKSPNPLIARGLGTAQRDAVSDLAARLGTTEWMMDETQFDRITTLTGCGPGFLYRFIAALAEGATALGIEADLAERLAKQMVAGAAMLAAESPLPPDRLARQVASPGGMTQAGFDVLDDDEALRGLMVRCLAAAADRGRDLARDATGTPPP